MILYDSISASGHGITVCLCFFLGGDCIVSVFGVCEYGFAFCVGDLYSYPRSL